MASCPGSRGPVGAVFWRWRRLQDKPINGRHVDVVVKNDVMGEAVLSLDNQARPIKRKQTVHFEEGTMNAVEARVSALRKTGATGGFSAPVVAGTYPVTVQARGFGSQTFDRGS